MWQRIICGTETGTYINIYIHTCKSKKSGFTCVFGTTKNMKTLAHKGHSDTLLWSKILTIPYKTITMPEN